MTRCYHNFYMMELNCSFPWLHGSKNYSKCGSKNRVMNLVNLINEVNLRTPTIIKELDEFGCLQQNCHQTNWEISSTQKIKLGFRQQGLIYFNRQLPIGTIFELNAGSGPTNELLPKQLGITCSWNPTTIWLHWWLRLGYSWQHCILPSKIGRSGNQGSRPPSAHMSGYFSRPSLF